MSGFFVRDELSFEYFGSLQGDFWCAEEIWWHNKENNMKIYKKFVDLMRLVLFLLISTLRVS